MSRATILFLLATLAALTLLPSVKAFGAGNIPSFSYLEEKAFRHGDIEDVISGLFKAASGGFLSRGTKFTPLDVKRVYFGNWLRDYSQAVDVGALKKTNLATILNIVMVLGFLAHGYVTSEFEVTRERLGCYLPTEHIDNPKGYADGEDARKYDPRLRGPVDPRELEVDGRTGMKNYIANEDGGWETSKGLVRRTLQQCIQMGRQFKQSGRKEDEYEAFRLLGQALHTLEDFSAHSNWCELALISFGYHNVFPHVGRNVKIRAPNGRDVPILVTGTFGGADFIHSLMGEATDHLSEASVSDLTKKMTSARSISEAQSTSGATLRKLLFDLPGGGGSELAREMDDVQGMRAGQPGGVDPSQMTPQELHRVLWQILTFRDSVMKNISNTIDKIPGLGPLVEKISNSISVFIITTLEPFVKPLLSTATSALGQSSQAVIDSHDQYEVWNDVNASDPTHSFLSKDHFGLILNQPAGEIARTIVEHTVYLVVKAWDNPGMDTEVVTRDVLQCMFHPDFHDGHSEIQRKMLEKMRTWIDTRGNDKQEILNRLTSENVRAGKNRRIGDTTQDAGHVHNSLLPEGGLQQVLAQHNVHVPGSQILNSGQDLLSGKMQYQESSSGFNPRHSCVMNTSSPDGYALTSPYLPQPWQQGFGSGGQHAWREMDDSASSPAARPTGEAASFLAPYGGGDYQAPGGAGYDSAPQPPSPYQSTNQDPQAVYYQSPAPPPQQGYSGDGGYGGYGNPAPPPPPSQGWQPGYGQEGYQPAYGQEGYQPGGYGGMPPPPPPPGQGWDGAPSQQGYGGPPPPGGQGQWGPPGQGYGPPGGYGQGGWR